MSLLAAEIERKSARELGTASLARRAGMKSGTELVQKLTGGTRADALKAVRVGVMLETAAEVAPLTVEAGAGARSTDVGAAAPGPRTLTALEGLSGRWDAPVAVAVRNAWLSPDQGDRLIRALGAPREPSAEPLWRAACIELIGQCWEGELTAEEITRAASAYRACLDRAWASENAHRLYEQRSLKRIVRADGMVKYDLLVDPMADAEIWTAVFRQLAPRLGGPRFMAAEEQQRSPELEVDSRSNEQLLADALTGFITAGINSTADAGSFGKYVPTVSVAITAAELRAAVDADAGPPVSVAADAPATPSATVDGIAWLDGKAEPITGARLLAAVCDGKLGAVLFDSTGQALDVTQHERTFSVRQRRAMALRDGGCLHPGCDMPPAACEGHHINPWGELPANRRTETRDGVLLCRFHHLNLHNHGARVVRRGSTYRLHWPGRAPVRLLPRHGVMAQLRDGDGDGDGDGEHTEPS